MTRIFFKSTATAKDTTKKRKKTRKGFFVERHQAIGIEIDFDFDRVAWLHRGCLRGSHGNCNSSRGCKHRNHGTWPCNLSNTLFVFDIYMPANSAGMAPGIAIEIGIGIGIAIDFDTDSDFDTDCDSVIGSIFVLLGLLSGSGSLGYCRWLPGRRGLSCSWLAGR